MSKSTAMEMRAEKKARQAQTLATAERRHLRSELLGLLGDIGSLVSNETSVRIAQESTSVGAFVSRIASALEGHSGTEHPGSVTVLGALSDLARMRMLPTEQMLSFETPSEILTWFAAYLERTLDKPDLRMG